MKRRKTALSLLIALAMMLSLVTPALGVTWEKNDDGSYTVRRKAGDPEKVFVAEYDEYGRMTAIHLATEEGVSTSPDKDVKIFQTDVEGKPKKEAIVPASAPTQTFTFSDSLQLTDRTFSGPVVLRYTGTGVGFAELDNCAFNDGLTIVTVENADLSVELHNTCQGAITVQRLSEAESHLDQGRTHLSGADGMTVEADCNLNVEVGTEKTVTLNGTTYTSPYTTWINTRWEARNGEALLYLTEVNGGHSGGDGSPCLTLTGTFNGDLLLFSGAVEMSHLALAEGSALACNGITETCAYLGDKDVQVENGVSDRSGEHRFYTTGTVYSNNFAVVSVNGVRVQAFVEEEFAGDKTRIYVGRNRVLANYITLNTENNWTTEYDEWGDTHLLVDNQNLDTRHIRLEVACGAGKVVADPLPMGWERSITIDEFAETLIDEYFGGAYPVTLTDEQKSARDKNLGEDRLAFLVDYAGFADRWLEQDADGAIWRFGPGNYTYMFYTDALLAFQNLFAGRYPDEPAPNFDVADQAENPGCRVQRWMLDRMLEVFADHKPQEAVTVAQTFTITRSEDGGYVLRDNDGNPVPGNVVSGMHFTEAVLLRNTVAGFDYCGNATFRNCTFDNGLTVEYAQNGSYDLYLHACPDPVITLQGSGLGVPAISCDGSMTVNGVRFDAADYLAQGGWYNVRGYYDDLATRGAFFAAVYRAMQATIDAMPDTAPTASFDNLPADAPYTAAVLTMARKGLVSASVTSFDPESKITRAQAATLLFRLHGTPTTTAAVPEDLQGHYAERGGTWAVEIGLMGLYDQRFAPDDPLYFTEINWALLGDPALNLPFILRLDTETRYQESGVQADYPPVRLTATDFADTLEISGHVDASNVTFAGGSLVQGDRGGESAVLTIGSNTLLVPGHINGRQLYFTQGGTVRLMNHREGEVFVNGTRYDLHANRNDGNHFINLFVGEMDTLPTLTATLNGEPIPLTFHAEEGNDWVSYHGTFDDIYNTVVTLQGENCTVIFDPVLREWERSVDLHELIRHRLVQDLIDIGRFSWEDAPIDQAALSATWPDMDWDNWNDQEGKQAMTLLATLAGEAAAAYEEPFAPLPYDLTRTLLVALLNGLGQTDVTATDFVVLPGKEEQEWLNSEEVEALRQVFRQKLPRQTVTGEVQLLLNDDYRLSEDGGLTWGENTLRAKDYQGPVTVVYNGEHGSSVAFENCAFPAGLTLITQQDAHLHVQFSDSCTGTVTVRRLVEEGESYQETTSDTRLEGVAGLSIQTAARTNIALHDGPSTTVNGVEFTLPENFGTELNYWREPNRHWDETTQEEVIDGWTLTLNLRGEGYWKDMFGNATSGNENRPVRLEGTLTHALRLSGVVYAWNLKLGAGGKLWLSGEQGTWVNTGTKNIYMDGSVGSYSGAQSVSTQANLYSDGAYGAVYFSGAWLQPRITRDDDGWIEMDISPVEIPLNNLRLYPAGSNTYLNWNTLSTEDYTYFLDQNGWTRLAFRESLVGDSREMRFAFSDGRHGAYFDHIPRAWEEPMVLNAFADAMIRDYFNGNYDDTWRDYQPSVEGMGIHAPNLNFLLDYAHLEENWVDRDDFNVWWGFRDMNCEHIQYRDVKTAFETLYREIYEDDTLTLPESVRITDDQGEWQDEYWVPFWAYDRMARAFNLVLPKEVVPGNVVFRIGRTEGDAAMPENEYVITLVDGEVKMGAGEWNHNIEGVHFTGQVTIQADGNPTSDYSGCIHFRNCDFDRPVVVESTNTWHYEVNFTEACSFSGTPHVVVTGSGQEHSVTIRKPESDPLHVGTSDDFVGDVGVVGWITIDQPARNSVHFRQRYSESEPELRESHITVRNNSLYVDENVRDEQIYTLENHAFLHLEGANRGILPIVNGFSFEAKAKRNDHGVWFDFCLEEPALVQNITALWNGQILSLERGDVDENGWTPVWGVFEEIENTTVAFHFNDFVLVYEPLSREWEWEVSLMEYLWELQHMMEAAGRPLSLPETDPALLSTVWDFPWTGEEAWGGEDENTRQLLTWAIQNAPSLNADNYDDPWNFLRHDTAVELATALWEGVKGEPWLPFTLIEGGLNEENAAWPMLREQIQHFVWSDLFNGFTAVDSLSGLIAALEQGGEVRLTASLKVYPSDLADCGVVPDGHGVYTVSIHPGTHLFITPYNQLFIGEGVRLVLEDGRYTPPQAGQPALTADGESYGLIWDESIGYTLTSERAFLTIEEEGMLLVSGELVLGKLSFVENGGELMVESSGAMSLAQGEILTQGYLTEEAGAPVFTPSAFDESRGEADWFVFDTGAHVVSMQRFTLRGALTVGALSTMDFYREVYIDEFATVTNNGAVVFTLREREGVLDRSAMERFSGDVAFIALVESGQGLLSADGAIRCQIAPGAEATVNGSGETITVEKLLVFQDATLTLRGQVTVNVTGQIVNMGTISVEDPAVLNGPLYHRGDDSQIYEDALSRFDTLMEAASAEQNMSLRTVKFAEAEAALLDSAVMMPTRASGGSYALSRIAPPHCSLCPVGQ